MCSKLPTPVYSTLKNSKKFAEKSFANDLFNENTKNMIKEKRPLIFDRTGNICGKLREVANRKRKFTFMNNFI
jgi:hypothetical protein